MRVMTVEQAAEVEARFRALTPFDPRCRIEVTGGLNRPPMERRFAVGLYEKARAAARELGIELEESLSGGGSDGNFTAALGCPDPGRHRAGGRRRARTAREYPGGPPG